MAGKHLIMFYHIHILLLLPFKDTIYLILFNLPFSRTVFSFVVSMLIFFITLALVHIVHLRTDQTILKTKACVLLGILSHFTFLWYVHMQISCIICNLCNYLVWSYSALSWMSIMNFDFFATFRNMSPSQERYKSLQRYLRYLLFAVGLPTLIVGISVIVHLSSGYFE